MTLMPIFMFMFYQECNAAVSDLEIVLLLRILKRFSCVIMNMRPYRRIIDNLNAYLPCLWKQSFDKINAFECTKT